MPNLALQEYGMLFVDNGLYSKEVKMKFKRDWLTEMLGTVDIMNTLHGGMSESQVKFSKNEDNYKVEVTTPGISAENLGVEVANNNLIVYHLLNFEEGNNQYGTEKIPHVLTSLIIPRDADYKNITANYQNGKLEVLLPFNELKNGYSSAIDIKRS